MIPGHLVISTLPSPPGNHRLKRACALLLGPLAAHAGVAYDVAVRPVDLSNVALASSNPAPPVVSHYFVQDGQVRVGDAGGKRVYVFKDKTLYVIDNASRTVHVLKHATLGQVAAHYADTVKQLQAAAANAPPDERPQAQRKAADMQLISERLLEPVTRVYRLTVRFETVDGHACRIWEEREKDAKRLELCVVPVSALPGGVDILAGLKTLSQFRQGSDLALGVDFGMSEWWPDVSSLGGIPLLIREYKYDSQIAEAALSAIRPGVPGGSLLDLPEGYPVQDGPDYAQWYLR